MQRGFTVISFHSQIVQSKDERMILKNLLNEKKNSTYQCCKYGDSTSNSHRIVSLVVLLLRFDYKKCICRP